MNDTETIEWKPEGDQIMTRWVKDIDPKNPLPEYPRPQLKRSNWINLNGLWNYAIRAKGEQMDGPFDGKILVPFPIESALSGVNKELRPKQKLWYQRSFIIPEKWKGMKVLLHFGAVDWETTVWINGNEVGSHQGGYTPFSFDISEFTKVSGENEILISVWDTTDKGTQERGKQVLKPGGIYYTAVSGIWQTVWLEPVFNTYIKKIKLITDVDSEKIIIEIDTENDNKDDFISVEVNTNEKLITSKTINSNRKIELEIPSPKLWEPANPFLYDLNIQIIREGTVIDRISSYFGMRKVELKKNNNGNYNIELNGKPIFQYGTLDQGYWPDGLYTAPTDEALLYDIQITKDLGFNMIRKHVKIEPARWYYHCDQLGMLVWQDMPSGGDSGFMIIEPQEVIKEIERSEAEKIIFYNELDSMINSLYNFPSVLVWVPFNEGWGQFDTNKVVEKVRELDSTRLIDSASGWYDKCVGDICDSHHYPRPKMPYNIGNRAAVVGEFGGLGLKVDNHMWEFEKIFVYRDHKNYGALMYKYEKLMIGLKKLIKKGLAAAIYTQITDVEGEVNGILTYDREIIKLDKNRLQELNSSLFSILLE